MSVQFSDYKKKMHMLTAFKASTLSFNYTKKCVFYVHETALNFKVSTKNSVLTKKKSFKTRMMIIAVAVLCKKSK